VAKRRVPRGPLAIDEPLETWARPPPSGLRATWLGHSTVLIEVEGLRVLTDPVWGRGALAVALAGPKRLPARARFAFRLIGRRDWTS